MMLHRGGGGAHHSFALSPHKISLCFLLFEAFQSPVLSTQKQEGLINFLARQIKVRYSLPK